ncbi:MAG: iron-containing alcohol dehydrogenase [Spirochaetales bacterium]|uniref:Iron-containing alcohol dehydrogenase n=1 Tax=Candidatus Thalassospirochaeta sargassi TaxID=3119039 RepID=A0AAJ1IJE0_9SPIO|nr:iron-containing alcohol dehydrogenase [Spirochaetales bacterium]
MYPFEYYIPTKVIFGEGRISELGEVASTFGKKIMFVSYDEDFVKSVGLLDKAMKPLKDAGLEIIPFFGAKPNPTVSHIREGIELAKKDMPDVIVALGGGSVIDTAKAIAFGSLTDVDIWDLATGAAEPEKVLPLIAVSTIPATSSEMNPTSVVSNEENGRKEGFVNALMFPKVAICDPELTYTLPIGPTAIAAADIVSHLLEAYLAHHLEWAPMQNRYSTGMIRTVIDCMDRLMKDPKDAEARAQLMWTATFAWNGFYPCGLGPHDAIIHIVGHTFSAFYDTVHGAAMSVTIPAIMKFHKEERFARYSDMAREVFGAEGEDSVELAQVAIDGITAWFNKIGAPVNFREANIPTDKLSEMADDMLVTQKNWGSSYYTKDMMLEILELCK